MDAHIALITAICYLAEKYGALTYLDDVRGRPLRSARRRIAERTASSTSRLSRT
jgi:7-keto-8-aminopelargonate synthetase-like enzyme